MEDPEQGASAGSVRWTEVFESLEANEFRELALLAGGVSRAPIALVTLVDEDRQWFTSVTGARLAAGPWEQTFCAHAVLQRSLFVVPDALEDPRFTGNPLVQAEPYVRFYAGAPLLADGTTVGTLCVMDVAPRQLPVDAAASLTALAKQVVILLQLRRQTRQLVKLNEVFAAEVLERQRSEARLLESEQALRHSQEALQRIDAERRELIANISHDLRTPLTSLQGYLDTVLMKADALDTAGQQRYIQQAATQSRRLARLVADLFELAQLDDRQLQLKAEPFELPELISDLVQSFAMAAEAKHIVLGMEMVDRSAVVVGEVRLIERVLANLLDNSIRLTPDGGAVTVSCFGVGDRVVVRVTDTGPGFSIEDSERIFERFYRGQSTPQLSDTAGLGLSSARRIVALHGGQLTAFRGPAGGAEFVFSLPRRVESAP